MFTNYLNQFFPLYNGIGNIARSHIKNISCENDNIGVVAHFLGTGSLIHPHKFSMR